MAEKATHDRVAADMQPPKFRESVQIIRHVITKKKEKLQSINSEIGDQWAKVEGNKVNKKAGRIFATLDKLDMEERTDIMRSLNGLIEAAGWDTETADLVDEAEGNVVHLRVGQPPEQQDDGGEEEMRDLEKDLEEPAEPAKPRRGRKPKAPDVESPADRAAANAKTEATARKARERLESEARRASGFGEPYTGDNSDLAGD